MSQSVFFTAGQTCWSVLEHEPVVREPDPARRREQVVVRERQVRAHHERIAEEDREADEPRAHRTRARSRAAARPRGAWPAIGRPVGSFARRPRSRHGACPASACFTIASICSSVFLSPPSRSFFDAREVLGDERLEGLLVRGSDARDRRRRGVLVAEDVQEGLEAGQRLQRRRLQRRRGRRARSGSRSRAPPGRSGSSRGT